MARMMRLFILMVLFIAMLAGPQALARTSLSGTQSSGAIYRIDLPDNFNNWNGDLVVYAHGFVRPDKPLEIPEDQLYVSGQYIPDVVTGMGYAFAVTSYSKNGLAVIQGVADVVDLVAIFKQTIRRPRHVYLAGVSEGGLVTTLAVEQYPAIFSGGLALCGPIGDFQRQIDYVGDFRVIFDYFFPGMLPPSPISIPQNLMDNYDSVYAPFIVGAIDVFPDASYVKDLFNVTHAPIDPSGATTRGQTAVEILWYNVFATNDAITMIGGQPFDNRHRVYTGSDSDSLINFLVQRFSADPAALAEIQAHYQTSGKLSRPLVSIHNSGDPIVPSWHETIYLGKVTSTGDLMNFYAIPIFRYGHVNLTLNEILDGFALLVNKVRLRERNVGAITLLLLE